MPIPTIPIIVGILSGTGGLCLGALIRQPEINELKAQIQKLQEELIRMQGVVKDVMKDVEILQLKLQLAKNNDVLESLKKMAEGQEDTDLGTLTYAYCLKEYLELKVNFLIMERDITEEEAVFVDAFALVLNEHIPEGEAGEELMRYIKEYIKRKYQNELTMLQAPDLKQVLQALSDRLAEHEKKESESTSQTTGPEPDPELNCLTLKPEYARLLYSLEYKKVQYDIAQTKDIKKRTAKQLWLNQWSAAISTNMAGANRAEGYIYQDSDLIYRELARHYDLCTTKIWYYLIAFELELFVPYFPFTEDKKVKQCWKGLNYKAEYVKNIYCQKQGIVSFDLLKRMLKTYHQSIGVLTNQAGKTVLSVAVTAAISLATAGLASAFAPAIATALVGSSFSGLSGAALANASLAFLGGGALAAGGMGMAGGAAIITGGGALLGMVGGGASTISAMVLLSSEGYTLRECAKLLSFSRVVLIDIFHSLTMVQQLQRRLTDRICELAKDIAALEIKAKQTKDEKRSLERIKKSMEYLKRCNKQLEKVVSSKAP